MVGSPGEEDYSSYKCYDSGVLGEGYKTGVRMYDPETGVFTSPDPFKGYLTEPASQHPYMYCHGNPVRYSDPSGYLTEDEWRALGNVGEGICWYLIGGLTSQLDSPLPGPGDAAGIVMVLRGTKAISAGIQLWGIAKAAKGTAYMSKATAAVVGHHAHCKYLGGAKKQELYKMNRILHNKYHGGLDKILPRQRGTGYWLDALNNTENREAILRKLLDYTERFDQDNGTEILKALKSELQRRGWKY